jgi:CubicO group peptidase (beta-lactamase class C family)
MRSSSCHLATAAILIAASAPAQMSALSATGSPVLGATYPFALSAPGYSGAPYVGALALDKSPGIAVGGGVVSLTPDDLFFASIMQPQPPELVAFQGTLGPGGAGAMSIAIPGLPLLDGLPFYSAFVTLDPTGPGGIGAISNSLRRQIRATPAPLQFAAVSAYLQAASAGWPPGDDGIGLAIVKDGQVVYLQAFGSFTPTTRVPIASASKWVTAATLMTLVRDGLLSLDTTVFPHVPTFTGFKSAITIRQCLSHTSGLPGMNACTVAVNSTLEACATSIGQGPLLALPGTEFRYGESSMHVAGRVAEVVTGQTWSALFAQRVQGPLGMSTFEYDAFGPTANPNLGGAGKCALVDYAAFLATLLDGGAKGSQPFLPTNLVDEMFLDQTNGATIVQSPRPGLRYGLGCWRDEVAPNGDPLVVSSPGLFGAWPWIDLERGYAAFLLIHQSTVAGAVIVSDLRPLIEAQL